MRYPLSIAVIVALYLVLCGSARAGTGLVIDGSFGSSITSLSDAAAVEQGIDDAINRLEAAVATNITVNIVFDATNSGLGSNSTYINDISYSQYRSDLGSNQTLSANDLLALGSLPSQATNPVNGNADLILTLPLLRAIGEAQLGNNGGGIDGTVYLNLSEMFVSRSGTPPPDEYDMESVATHEMDEVLGIGGLGSELNFGTSGAVGPLDLFRYSATGVRSYTQSPNASSYFSINGGTTNLVYFNQGAQGDFGDWGDGAKPADDHGNMPSQTQDAFLNPGVVVNLGPNELTALDVVGYTLRAVPEPGAGSGVMGLAAIIAVAVRKPMASRLRRWELRKTFLRIMDPSERKDFTANKLGMREPTYTGFFEWCVWFQSKPGSAIPIRSARRGRVMA